MTLPKDWDGEERRGIPIHILNYVDTKMDDHLAKVQALVEENNQHVDKWNKDAEERHNQLTHQLSILIGKQELINTAFVEDHRGEPDYHGHRHDHLERKTRAEKFKEWRDDTLKKIGTGAIYSAVGVLALVIWEAFKVAVQKP